MNDFDLRDAKRTASMKKLQEVALAGQTSGHWTITRTSKNDAGKHWSFADITTPDNLHFMISGGSWSKENKIGANLDTIETDGIKVSPRDVVSYNEDTPSTAYISSDKAVDRIISDILKRVINNPDYRDIAVKMNECLASRLANKASLSGHIETLAKMGFSFRERNNTYSAICWHDKFNNVTVYENGRVSLECTLPIDKVQALINLIGD